RSPTPRSPPCSRPPRSPGGCWWPGRSRRSRSTAGGTTGSRARGSWTTLTRPAWRHRGSPSARRGRSRILALRCPIRAPESQNWAGGLWESPDGTGRGGPAGPDAGLQLGVGLQAVAAAVTPRARLLEPAEGRLVLALQRVEPDVARAEPLRDLPRPTGVGAEHVGVQPVVGVVRDRDRLVLVVEGHDDDHRTEDLLAHRGHRVVAVDQQGQLHVVAGVHAAP